MNQTYKLLFAILVGSFFFSIGSINSLSQVKDFDNNNYKTIKIGDKEWMAENLNVEHYRNGDIIPQVQDNIEWLNLTTGAWCYYENKTENGTIYGKLYNWYAVTDSRGLVPEGWHIPDKTEWQSLAVILGENVAGKKLKSINGWDEDAEVGTNESGFNGLPGGYREGWKKADKRNKGIFVNMDKNGDWWTISSLNEEIIWDFNLDAYSDQIGFWKHYKTGGLSVRCVKD
jgi:uncharacterized protein (TIGR02145 family)